MVDLSIFAAENPLIVLTLVALIGFIIYEIHEIIGKVVLIVAACVAVVFIVQTYSLIALPFEVNTGEAVSVIGLGIGTLASFLRQNESVAGLIGKT